jgi:peptidoglycan hydrolase CwlO-like protein
MEKKVLTTEELQSIKDIQKKKDQLTIDFGYLEVQIQELKIQKESLNNLLVELKNQESKIGQEITAKYGKGSINLDNGEFTIID